jgi:4-hydroxy-2-oxoheptanedioate aldolase
MDLPVNQFKRAILSGDRQIGLWCTLNSSVTVEIAAGAGFDWLLLDTEHTPSDDHAVLQQLQTAAAYPVSTVVRPAWNDAVRIKRLLDVGAQSLLVPYVQTAEEAAEAVSAVRYPPQGIRGVAGATRATRYGRIGDYFARCSDEICLLVQLETLKALENLEQITATDGIDGVFIGPADLAADMGYGGNKGHADVQKVIDTAMARIQAGGKAAGILSGSEAEARRFLNLGASFVAVGVDAVLLARVTAELATRFKGLSA